MGDHQGGDEIEQAGGLSADTGANFDKRLAGISPQLHPERDALAKRKLRPEQMVIREELRSAKEQTLAVRRIALRKLLLEDFVQEEKDLRSIGLAYARP